MAFVFVGGGGGGQCWGSGGADHYFQARVMVLITRCCRCFFVTAVDEMINEVDIDGDGRIDFDGKG